MPRPILTVGDLVYDRWWPERLGRVIRLLRTRVHVEWADGEVWNYDLPHAVFLAKEGARRAG